METTRGRLLVANGSLLDPNFRRAVILVADHDEDGAAGVVLNRRSETTVAEAAPPLLGEAVLVEAVDRQHSPAQHRHPLAGRVLDAELRQSEQHRQRRHLVVAQRVQHGHQVLKPPEVLPPLLFLVSHRAAS